VADKKYRHQWGNAHLGREVGTWLTEGWLSETGAILAAKLGHGEQVAAELWGALSMSPILEFSRMPAFLDVTLRLIVERLLPRPRATFLQGELSQVRPKLHPLSGGRRHVFCSSHNAGALELIQEVEQELNLTISTATSASELRMCQTMLIYLDGRTWTSANKAAFSVDVKRAIALSRVTALGHRGGHGIGVRLLLVHEMPDVEVEPGRHAVEFASFFAAGATPRELIDAGIYTPIATSLKGGVWRQTSLVMLVQALRAAMPFGGARTGSVKHLAKLASRRSRVPRTSRSGSARPVVLLAMQEAQRQHELALEQEESDLRQGRLPDSSIELDSSHPGRRLSGASGAGRLFGGGFDSPSRRSRSSRSSRRYEAMDDDIAVSQGGL